MADRPAQFLCLDLATSIGVAVGSPGRTPRAWSHRLPSTGEELGPFLAALDSLLEELIAEWSPSHIIMEAPIIRNGKTALATARKLYCLAGHTEWTAWRHKIPCYEAQGDRVTGFFTGRSRYPGKTSYARRAAKKRAVIDKCERLGWPVDDDDAADAIALFCWAEHILFPEAREIAPLFAAVSGHGARHGTEGGE